MEEKKENAEKKRRGRPPMAKKEAPEEHKERKRSHVDPRRKCHSFYCTSDEYLYIRSLLTKIRRVLNSMEPEPAETKEEEKEPAG